MFSVTEKNKTAIVLVPEISLTPQMVDRFIARFGQDKIAVLHSKLSIGERYDQWNKIKNGECKIVIGARSAIFAPVENLGLIIIDEEHDSSYKSETNPRYNAKELAGFMARKNNIPLVLGTATPDANTYFKAQSGQIEVLQLTKRANKASLPDVEIIDLRQELANGNRSILSTKLYEEIENNLKNKKQTILFLNRRGYSTFIMCRECGYVAKCSDCDVSLVYHKYENVLKCHYCGNRYKVFTECPDCGNESLSTGAIGTQRVVQELLELFPDIKIGRMDNDTTKTKNSHLNILSDFRAGKTQIFQKT